jgi:SAM-dependent methyltransferase
MFLEWSEQDKQEYVKETKQVCDIVGNLGFQSHLQFGTLLGFVRDGKLIDRDTDIDICYLSNFNVCSDVRQECYELYRVLKDRGLLVRYWNQNYSPEEHTVSKDIFGQAHIRVGKFIVDLFTSWIDINGDYWTCQYGNFGKTEFRKATFYGYEFNIPTETNKILTRLFGDWQTPCDDKPSKYIDRKCYMINEITAEKIEPMTQKQLEGVCEELKFWKGFVKTKRFSGWIANSPTPELCEYAQEKILSMNPITILDVGSGPVSILTGLTGAKLTTADLLGDFYQLIFDFEKHGITPPVAIPAEQLILDRKFDLVHMSNALDHCQDPELVIQRLWNLVDFGGHLMIQGFVDEGKYERYRGLHSWDLGVYRGRITCNGADISEVGTAEEFSRNNRQWFVWYSQKSRV